MGLFSRKKKDKGIIDLGDGQVAISPERQQEFVDHSINQAIGYFDEGLTAAVWNILEMAVWSRHGTQPSEEVLEWLKGLAHMGYCSRQAEDEMESVEAAVPWLTNEIKSQAESAANEEPEIETIFTQIALSLCDTSRDDPSAPRSIDAISSAMVPLRDQVCARFVDGAAGLAANDGLCERDDLPPGVDWDELNAVWRIGFIVRTLEQSIPSNWADPDVTLIVVDSEAAKEAFDAWSEANPNCTEEESDAVAKSVMLDPQFRIDVDDERLGVDPRFVMFELDANGEIIRQD